MTDKETRRQTDGQTKREQTDGLTEEQTRQIDKRMCWQQAYVHANVYMAKQTDWWTNGETDRKTDIYTDVQTD